MMSRRTVSLHVRSVATAILLPVCLGLCLGLAGCGSASDHSSRVTGQSADQSSQTSRSSQSTQSDGSEAATTHRLMFRAEVSAGQAGADASGGRGATAVILTETSPKAAGSSFSHSTVVPAQKTVYKTARLGSVWHWSADYRADKTDGQLFPVWLSVASDAADKAGGKAGDVGPVTVSCEIGIDGWLISHSSSTIRPGDAGSKGRAASLCAAQSADELRTATKKMTLDGPWKTYAPSSRPSSKKGGAAALGTSPVVRATSDGKATVIITGAGLSTVLSKTAGTKGSSSTAASSAPASAAFPLVSARFASKWASVLMPPDQLGPFTVTVMASGSRDAKKDRSAGCTVTYGDRTLASRSATGPKAKAVCTYSHWNQ
jgi:hypothetical protein